MAIGNHGPSSLKGWRDGLYNSSSLDGRLGGSKRGPEWPKFRGPEGGPEGGVGGLEVYVTLCTSCFFGVIFTNQFGGSGGEKTSLGDSILPRILPGFSVDPSGPPLPFSPIKLLIKEPHLDPPWTPPPDP